MDFSQLNPQIGTLPASGELNAYSGGHSFGAPSHERGFSTVLRTLSHKVDDRREAPSPAPHSESGNSSSSTTSTVRRGVSRKSDGSRGTKPRTSQKEAGEGSSSTAGSVGANVSRKTVGRAETEAPVSRTERKDESFTTQSDASTTSTSKASIGTDDESRAEQFDGGDEPSTSLPGSDPLMLSLLGSTIVTTDSTVDSSQETAGVEIAGSEIDGRDILSESSGIQPMAHPAEEVTLPMPPESGAVGLVDQSKTSDMGEAVAAPSASKSEGQPGSENTDTGTPVVAQFDAHPPITALQGEEAQRLKSLQGLPIAEPQEQDVSHAPVPSGQTAGAEQDLARLAATVPTQQTDQDGAKVVAESNQSLMQQIPGKGEPSLRQKHMQAAASEPQSAAGVPGYMQAEGQSFKSGSDGKGSEAGLKWLAHVDLQSGEASPRMTEPVTADSVEAGHQYPSIQQGQGGAPSNSRPASTPTVPSSPQASPLGPDPEATPMPRTHAVHFDLSPADFGQLRVRVVLSDHTIHTNLSTDRAELGQMLSGQQEQLSTQLSAAGLDLGRFHVQVDQGKTNQSGQESPSQAHNGTSQQQRDPRQQDRPQEVPVPVQKRSGVLSLFA